MGRVRQSSGWAISLPASFVVFTAGNIRQPEETYNMEQKRHQENIHGLKLGRIVTSAFAVGGLSASALAVSTAGASAKSVVVGTVKSAKFGTILASGKALYTL